jgi:hypothetical protein
MKQIYLLRYGFLVLFICLSNWVMAQTGTISGRIIDDTNLPLPGATVILKGTTISAAADANGYFKLVKAPLGPQVLVVRFVGYQQMEQPVTVNATTNVTLQLKSSNVLLEQVAVVGYGTVRKSRCNRCC